MTVPGFNDLLAEFHDNVSPYAGLAGDGGDFLGDWPGVVRAVKKFGEKIGIAERTQKEKWLFRKGPA